MKYELIPKSNRGVLIDRIPILRDVRDTFEVSFLLPGEGSYLALFTDADGVEYRKPLIAGKVKIPEELFSKAQYAGLIVCEIDGEKILNSWDCEPLRVTAFLDMRCTQWQLSGGMTDKDCFARLVELERLYTQSIKDITTLTEESIKRDAEISKILEEYKKEFAALSKTIELLKEQNKGLAENYNKAIGVVNKLAERLGALEKNYDPTVID